VCPGAAMAAHAASCLHHLPTRPTPHATQLLTPQAGVAEPPLRLHPLRISRAQSGCCAMAAVVPACAGPAVPSASHQLHGKVGLLRAVS
jgi:hypothetical protein